MRKAKPASVVALAVLAALVLPRAAGDFAFGATCDTPGAPTTTVYLPNITKTLGGPAGWYTPFIVQNVGETSVTLEVSFYRFADGSLVTCRKVTGLAPGTSFADVPNNDADLPHDTQFSVVVRAFGAPVVSVVNEHQSSGSRAENASYVGLASGATSVYLPWVAKHADGWLTTFIMQNLGTAPTTITARFISLDSTKTATLTRSAGPGRSTFIDPSVEGALAAGVEYAVTLTADQAIAAVVNAHNDALSVAAPRVFSYNGSPAPTASEAFLPLVTRNSDGIGRTSRIVVQNAGTSDATPTLTLRAFAGGGVYSVSAPRVIKPGASWSFDPRFAANGTTPCPPSGGAGCAPEGELSAVVSGGRFAVLNALLSPATAMGYTGATAATRLYLPNITRTLGGANGWTTPIVLQSAGATSATLRWYRFADGQLVQTQMVGGLASGTSARVDPRAVAGLAEDTQYAVVVEAAQPVAAIVTELTFTGGDGAMAYEGFAPPPRAAAPSPTPTPIARPSPAPTPTASPTPLPSIPPSGPYTVSGRLTAADTGAPLAGGAVYAFAGTMACCASNVAATRVDASGTYRLSLTAGYYRLRFVAPAGVPYASLWWGGAKTFLTARDLAVTGETSGIDAALPVGRRVSGRITRAATGAPLARAVLGAFEGRGVCSTARCSSIDWDGTDENGAFALVLQPGTYRLRADPPEGSGLIQVWWRTAFTYQTAADLPITVDLRDVDIAVPLRLPTKIEVTPGSPRVYGGTANLTQQFTAAVQDQAGGTMPDQPVSWSVSPASLGTISATGLFRASARGGSGSVTATSGGATGAARIVVSPPSGETFTVGGITFTAYYTESADLYTETSISQADAQTIFLSVKEDVVRIQNDYRRRFGARPALYVFGSDGSFRTGLETVLLMPPEEAATIATTFQGVAEPTTVSAAMNWGKARQTRPVSTPRHEFTHLMIHQIIKSNRTLPAWLDEGSARLEELTVPGSQWRAMHSRYSAASMAATNTLFALSDLTDQKVWNARTGLPASYQYHASAEAVRLLRDDIRSVGVLRILELLGEGQETTFESAYAAVAGRSFQSFAADYARRLLALAPAYPGIASAPDTVVGPGLSMIFYGFTPNTTVSVRIEGGGGMVETTRTANAYGVSTTFLAETWPAGPYAIRATGANGTVTVSVAKTTSALSWSTTKAARTLLWAAPDAELRLDFVQP